MAEGERADLVRRLEDMPESIRQLSDGLTDAQLRWKPSDDEFSVLEQVCHLRDLEREGYAERIRRMIAEDEPALADFDGSSIARERDYNHQDFASSLSDFAAARSENVRALKSLSPGQLNRKGVLEGVGSITLNELFHMMRAHDQSHREELKDLERRRRALEDE